MTAVAEGDVKIQKQSLHASLTPITMAVAVLWRCGEQPYSVFFREKSNRNSSSLHLAKSLASCFFFDSRCTYRTRTVRTAQTSVDTFYFRIAMRNRVPDVIRIATKI